WSGTHPFYTGEQRLIDTEGQVDRFMKRLRRREKLESDLEAAKPKEQDPLALTVPEMGVSTRSAKAINEAGHTTVGDVLTLWKEAGDDALLAISGVGQTALISIKRHLRSAGLIE
ncbi:MAG: 50S ribosomal protein L31, partial [Methylococcales bacterium]|nr:50S ribosomal protein L31 [Methylococcales bacterium]